MCSSCVSGRCAQTAFPNVCLALGAHPQLECAQARKEQHVPAAGQCLQPHHGQDSLGEDVLQQIDPGQEEQRGWEVLPDLALTDSTWQTGAWTGNFFAGLWFSLLEFFPFC